MGAIVLAVGALLGWLAVAFLHYSDSQDRQLARGVSALDSLTLVCVLAHFTFLLWTFGHLKTLQSAEREYKQQAEKYNERGEKISADNAKIAASAERIATETTKAERLRNDSIYQARKAAEAGARIPGSRTAPVAAVAPALTTAQIELEKPPKPAEASAAFLTRWDFWIRATNLAELLLAAATLIYIRNRSAATNTPTSAPVTSPVYSGVTARTPAVAALLRQRQTQTHVSFPAPVSSTQRQTPTQTHVSSTFNREGLRLLRESLKDISFGLRGISFKADVKPAEGCVWIRAMQAVSGTQQTLYSTRATLEILDDAMTMQRDAYRERLERFLRQNGFQI
jgi:hypothetical protein